MQKTHVSVIVVANQMECEKAKNPPPFNLHVFPAKCASSKTLNWHIFNKFDIMVDNPLEDGN